MDTGQPDVPSTPIDDSVGAIALTEEPSDGSSKRGPHHADDIPRGRPDAQTAIDASFRGNSPPLLSRDACDVCEGCQMYSETDRLRTCWNWSEPLPWPSGNEAAEGVANGST
jgi:hypothetical protein